jgi:hypothetical protein
MAIRNTLNVPPKQQRTQIRNFAIIWTGLTLLMGAAAFVAIYGATGIYVTTGNRFGLTPAALAGAAVSPATPTVSTIIASNTPLPTDSPNNAPTKAAENNSGAPEAKIAGDTVQVAPLDVINIVNSFTGSNMQVTATPISNAFTAATVAPTLAPTLPPKAQATVPAIKDENFDLGIQVQPPPDLNPATHDTWLKMVSDQLKLNWVKHQVRWRDLEKTKGQIDFSTLDLILPEAAKYNVKVLLSIVTAPDWAREPGVAIVKDRQGPPANPQDYVNFVTAILKKYPGTVHAIEVWNEQNLDREWDSPKGLVAAQYVQLLSQTYTAVKAIDPNIIILSGALSPTGTSNPPKWFDDFVYLDQLIKAGMLQYADCVGAHHNGYNIGPTVTFQDAPKDPKRATAKFRGPFDNPNHLWSFNSTLSGYASRIKAAGSSLKLCVTEFGWPSMDDIKVNGKTAAPPQGFEFAADNTLADQADYTNQAIDVMTGWGYVRLAFIWNLNYGAQIGWDPKNDNVPYSILGAGFQPRPVWQKIVDRNFRGKAR